MRSSLAYDSSKDSAWFHDRSFQVHLKKLQEIRGRNLQTDSSPNAGIRASLSRLKALSFIEAERIETIKRENKILMKKLVAIAEAKADRPLGKSLEHRSLNFQLRKKEEDRIRMENEAFSKRLQLKEGCLSKKKLDFSFIESQRHKKLISKVNILKGRLQEKLQGHLPPLNESDSDSKLNISVHTEMKANAKVRRSTKGYSRTLDASPLNRTLQATDFTKSPGGVTLEQYLDSKGDIAVLADKKNVRKLTKAIPELPDELDKGSGRVNATHSKRSSVNQIASGSQPVSTRSNKDSPKRDTEKSQKPRQAKVDVQPPKEEVPLLSPAVLQSPDELDCLPPRFASEPGITETVDIHPEGDQVHAEKELSAKETEKQISENIKEETAHPTQELPIVKEEEQPLESLNREEGKSDRKTESAKEESLVQSPIHDATLELHSFKNSEERQVQSVNQEVSPPRTTSAQLELLAQEQSLPENLEPNASLKEPRPEVVGDPELDLLKSEEKSSEQVAQDAELPIVKPEQESMEASERIDEGDELPLVKPENEPREANLLLAQDIEAPVVNPEQELKKETAGVDEDAGLMINPEQEPTERNLEVAQDGEFPAVKTEQEYREASMRVADNSELMMKPEPELQASSSEVAVDSGLPVLKPEPEPKEASAVVDEGAEMPIVNTEPEYREASVRVAQSAELIVKPEPDLQVSSSEVAVERELPALKSEPEPKETSAVVDEGVELSIVKPEQELIEENEGVLTPDHEDAQEEFQGAEPKSPTVIATGNVESKELEPESANQEFHPSEKLLGQDMPEMIESQTLKPEPEIQDSVSKMKAAQHEPEEVVNALNESSPHRIDPKATGHVQEPEHEGISASEEEPKVVAQSELPQDRS